MERIEPQRPRRPLRATAALALPFGCVAALVAVGAFQGLGVVNRVATLASLLTYAVLTWASVAALARWRTALPLLGAFAVVAAVSVAAAELALRRLHPEGWVHELNTLRFSPALHHVNVPDLHSMVFSGPEQFMVETNRDGLRSRRTREQVLRHGKRIAVLGDSFTFGLFVDQDDAFPQRMETLLREDGVRDVAVLNAGITSYSPFLEKFQYREVVAAYRPQLLILLLDATDIGDDYLYEGLASNAEGADRFGRRCLLSLVPRHSSALDRSLVYQRAWPTLFVARALLHLPIVARCPLDFQHLEVDLGGQLETNHFFIFRHPLSLTGAYFDRTFEHVREIAAEARAAGAYFMLVVAPRYQHWNPEESPDNWELRNYAVPEPHQFEFLRYFEQQRRTAGFEIVSLLPAFRAAAERRLVLTWDPHWNAAGHDVAARALAPLVRRRLEARPRPTELGHPVPDGGSKARARDGEPDPRTRGGLHDAR